MYTFFGYISIDRYRYIYIDIDINIDLSLGIHTYNRSHLICVVYTTCMYIVYHNRMVSDLGRPHTGVPGLGARRQHHCPRVCSILQRQDASDLRPESG